MLTPLSKSDLNYDLPPGKIATSPQRPSRVLWVENKQFSEISISDLIKKIPPGDVLVVNETKVLPRRIYSVGTEPASEILFIQSLDTDLKKWSVLFPSKKLKIGARFLLPGDIEMTFEQKGRPQVVTTSEPLTSTYFSKYADLPLPPYIQALRESRRNVAGDLGWYQSQFAAVDGSLAAPTASLHFSKSDLEALQARGIEIVKIVLHVGLGTFLPIVTEDLDQHEMHEEMVSIPAESLAQIRAARARGKKIWALGTTVARSLESQALGILSEDSLGNFVGPTKLFIRPGFQFKSVDRLMTNFHQPESTLLALVAAFSSLETVKLAYQYAIEHDFRFLSYGDLTVWT